MVDGLDNLAERERRLYESLAFFRKRLREIAPEDYAVFDLERDLDVLLMQCANLAREPLLRHMSKVMEAAAMLAPRPFAPNPHTTYPDPRKGATSAVDNPKEPDSHE